MNVPAYHSRPAADVVANSMYNRIDEPDEEGNLCVGVVGKRARAWPDTRHAYCVVIFSYPECYGLRMF